MFKIFARVSTLEESIGYHKLTIKQLLSESDDVTTRLRALEQYLGIEFFNGPTQKPHYRKVRVITKKLGRPKKVTK